MNSCSLPNPIGTSADDFVVDMHHDWIAGGLDPEHRLDQNVARNPRDDVLEPDAAISAITAAAGGEPAAGVVVVHDACPVAIVDDKAGIRIRKLAAARQFDLQERAVALQNNRAAD